MFLQLYYLVLRNSLLQADGNLTEDEFEEALDLAIGGCQQIAECQRKALKARYGE